MTDLESEVGRRLARWRRVMNRESHARMLFLVRWEPPGFDRPCPLPDAMPARIEWSWNKYCRQIEKLSWLDDDSIPYLDCYTGTEIFAEAFGAEVYRPEDSNPYAKPVVFRASEASALRTPDLDTPGLKRMFDAADELVSRAGSRALVRLVDIQSPMDVVAILWDKSDLFIAMLDAPEAVLEVAEKVRTLMVALLDEWFRRYGTTYIAHYPDYPMDGGVTLSEDEIGSVSPEMFEAFFLPELNSLSRRYGGLGMHCCAHARHQWPAWRKIDGLRLLNLVQPPDVLQASFCEFESDVLHWPAWTHDGAPWEWRESLPSQMRVVIEAQATSREDAQRIADRMNASRS